MMRTHQSAAQRVPLRIWHRAIDPDVLTQLTRLAAHPRLVEAVCAMPDAHLSGNIAVGTVFATENAVIPAALGGDLGCGVHAQSLTAPSVALDRRLLRRLVEELARNVPVGDRTHRTAQPLPSNLADPPLSTRALSRERDRLAPLHVGTLGGGNHFLELDRDVEGDLWLLVHCGSRGLGSAIGDHHRRVAEAEDSSPSLHCLDTRSAQGQRYIADHAWALAFAAYNRARIAESACAILHEYLGVDPNDSPIDVHHNHVLAESHFGRLLYVHRKGAVRTDAEALTVIPGSMGTASYIAEGAGNPASFCSASHGAGRVLSRGEAHRSLRADRVARSLRHVEHHVSGAIVEEAPQAYRDIAEVLADQRDLVRPLLRLEPLIVLKG